MYKRLLSLVTVFTLLFSPLSVLTPLENNYQFASVSYADAGGPAITGTFFADVDVDGFSDPGEVLASTDSLYPPSNIAVYAYDATGASVQCSITGADNNEFLCPVISLAGTDFRIEFELTDAGFNEAFGTHSSVQFASAGDDILFGYMPPSLCPLEGEGFEGNTNSAEGKLWTTCFVNGDRSDTDGPQDVLVGMNYDVEGKGPSGDFTVEHLGYKNGGGTTDSGNDNSELGAVWGVAYDQWASTLFTSAMIKRHADLGARGTDGLYWMSYPSGTWNSVDLDSLGGSSYGADLTGRGLGTALQSSYDTEAFALVGKSGIGDINLTPNGRTLLVTNLEAREVSLYDVSSIPLGGSPSYLGSVAITNPGCSDAANTDDYQIWGLHVNDDNSAYLGVHCTAENSTSLNAVGLNTDLEAHLVALDISSPAAPTQSASLLTIPLDYERGCGLGFPNNCPTAGFLGWSDVWNPYGNTYNSGAAGTWSMPQPIFSDIEVHSDGSMTLGIMDRFGHQSGGANFSPDPDDPLVTNNGVVSGEVLHVCNTSGDPQNPTFAVEGQAGCDSTTMYNHDGLTPTWADTTNGRSIHGGPYEPFSEWYGNDTMLGDMSADKAAFHQETSLGGIYARPYTSEMVTSAMDPVGFRTGGLVWMSTVAPENTGSRTAGLYNSKPSYLDPGDGTFEKAAGIGDVEGCFVPMEIGNFVWLDLDQDGIQDPGEMALEGVTVTLKDAAGNILATTTTDVNGEYYFNTIDGVNPNTQYTIEFDKSTLVTTLPGGYTAADLLETTQDAAAGTSDTSQDNSDSDIVNVSANISSLTFTTGAQGENDHTLDAGYKLPFLYDLALAKTTTATLVKVGDTVTFDITVSNQGNSSADNITITDYIPSGYTLNDADWTAGTSGTSGQSASITLSVANGALPAGGLPATTGTVSVPIDLTVAVGATNDTLTNYAEISAFTDDAGGTQDDIDSTPDATDTNDTGGTLDDPAQDNVITDDGTVDEDDHDPASVELGVYDLALAKTTTATLVKIGDTVTFDIAITNQGDFPADNITITDYIPSGYTLNDADWTAGTSGTSGQSASITLSVANGALPAGGLPATTGTVSVPIDLTVAVGATNDTLTNYAEISAFTDDAGGTQDDIDSTPDATDTNDTGGTLDDPAQDNVITDDGTVDEDDHDPASVELGVFDLALAKTTAATLVGPGDTVTFDIAITNQGDFPADNITITDYIPSGYTLNDADWTAGTSGTSGQSASITLSVANGALPAGGLPATTGTVSVPIDLTVAVGATNDTLTNYAEISAFTDDAGGTQDDIDSTPDATDTNDTGGTLDDPAQDNVITDDGTVDEDDHDPASVMLLTFDLALAKTTASTLVNPGDTVTFNIAITNQSNVPADNITITDYIPSGYTLNDADWTAGTSGTSGQSASITLSVANGALPAGGLPATTGTVSVPIDLTVAAGATNDTLVNYAEISGATDNTNTVRTDVDSTPDDTDNNDAGGTLGTPGEDDVITDDGTVDEDDHDPAAVYLIAYDLALKKTTAATLVDFGDDVTFVIDVTNQGNIAADNITITDYIPSGYTLNDADWTAGTSGTSGQSASITLSVANGALPAGGLALDGTVTVPITLTVLTTAVNENLINYAEISSSTDSDGNQQTDIDSTPDDSDTNDVGGTPDDPEQDDVISNNGSTDEDDHDPAYTYLPYFDLALKKTSDVTSAEFGDDVTFTIEIFNQGIIPADNITISDYIPTGFELNDVSWTGTGSQVSRQLTVAAGDLPVGGLLPDTSVTVTIVLTVLPTATDETLINFAEITEATDEKGQDRTDIDSTPDADPDNDTGGTPENPGQDNVVTDDGTIDEDDHDPAPVKLNYFDLALKKTGIDTGPVTIGDNITFTITVYNQGNIAADNITITDYIPAGLILNDATWVDAGNSAATKELSVANGYLPADGLLPGQNTPVQIILQVAPDAVEGSIINVAEIASATDILGEVKEDIDSIPDADKENDNGGRPGTTEDNNIDDDGTIDEDDHDPIEIELVFAAQCTQGATIGNKIFEDVNCNGKYDKDIDEPLDDIEVKLKDSSGETIDTDKTNSKGKYELRAPGTGTYQVVVDSDDVEDYTYSVDPGSKVNPNNKAYVSVDECGDNTTKMDFGFIVEECHLAETGFDTSTLMCIPQ